jgi:hypothetical protein
VVEEGTDVEQVTQGNAMGRPQIPVQPIGVTDVSPKEMAHHTLLGKVIGRRVQGRPVEVGPHKHQRMRVQMLTAQGLLSDERLEVKEQRTIATSHVTQSSGLIFQRSIENGPHHLVEMMEIGPVSPSASPDVQGPVHMDFGIARRDAPQMASISEQQLVGPQEGTGVRRRHPECRGAGEEKRPPVRAEEPEILQSTLGRFTTRRV